MKKVKGLTFCYFSYTGVIFFWKMIRFHERHLKLFVLLYTLKNKIVFPTWDAIIYEKLHMPGVILCRFHRLWEHVCRFHRLWEHAWSSGKVQDSWSLDHQYCEFEPRYGQRLCVPGQDNLLRFFFFFLIFFFFFLIHLSLELVGEKKQKEQAKIQFDIKGQDSKPRS